MSDYNILIPEDLYEKAQRIAAQGTESVDELIRKRLELSLSDARLGLPEDERAELQALAYLSEAALWTIVREQIPSQHAATMQVLMDKNSMGTISSEEYLILENLVEQSQRLTLRKSEAMKLLIQRGIQVSLEDLDPEHD